MNVLFIGNSFTARTTSPTYCATGGGARQEPAASSDQRRRCVAAPALERRRNALKAIQDGRYDYVVLQEQSTLPIKNVKRMHENVRLFDEAIRAAGARTVLYMTWAQQHALESQQAITDAYTSIGRELGATVVPVGVAWQHFLRKHDQPVFHDRDQSHPTLAGSYLAACVFLAMLLKESPVGIDGEIAGLAETDRLRIQNTVWQQCNSIASERNK